MNIIEERIEETVKGIRGVYTERGMDRKMRDDDARAELCARELIPEVRAAENMRKDLALREIRDVLRSLDIISAKRAGFEGYMEGKTMKEIGDGLGISAKCAWKHVSETKEMIRDRFRSGNHDWYEAYIEDTRRF